MSEKEFKCPKCSKLTTDQYSVTPLVTCTSCGLSWDEFGVMKDIVDINKALLIEPSPIDNDVSKEIDKHFWELV